jgi:hypothetical protein
MNAFANQVLLDDATARRGFLDVDRLESVLSGHASGHRNAGSLIWSLLIFELWCRQILD